MAITVAALSAASPALVASAASPNATLPLNQQDLDDEDVAQAAEYWGVSNEEAEGRLRRQQYVGMIHNLALALYPDSYAGLWIDHENQGAFTFLFAEPDPANLPTGMRSNTKTAEIKAEAIGEVISGSNPAFVGAKFAGEAVTHPWIRLETLYRSLDKALWSLRQTGILIDALQLDQASNAVRAYVADEASGTRLAEAYPDPALDVIVADVALEDTVCNSRYDCVENPLRGGLAITTVWPNGATWLCTSAFNAWNGVSRYTLTAGHCVRNFTAVSHNGERIGVVPADGYSDPQQSFADFCRATTNPGQFDCRLVDAARVFVERPTAQDPYFTVSNQFVQSSANTSARVESRAQPEEVRRGVLICFVGRVTNNSSCWDNNQGHYVIWDHHNNTYRVEAVVLNGEFTFCRAQQGDSGGPMYSHRRAFGITSGNLQITPDIAGVEPGGGCVGTHIRYAEEFLNVTVLTDSTVH